MTKDEDLPTAPSGRPPCIDLRQTFGQKYRIRRDPAYYAEHGQHGRAVEPWLMTIPCKHGEIYPHGGTTLAASTLRNGSISKRLRNLPCCKVWQDSQGDGVTFLFDVKDIAQVAAIIQPRLRRRPMNPDQAAALAARGAAALCRYREANAQSDSETLCSDSSDHSVPSSFQSESKDLRP